MLTVESIGCVVYCIRANGRAKVQLPSHHVIDMIRQVGMWGTMVTNFMGSSMLRIDGAHGENVTYICRYDTPLQDELDRLEVIYYLAISRKEKQGIKPTHQKYYRRTQWHLCVVI
jgi:hypothetical protein